MSTYLIEFLLIKVGSGTGSSEKKILDPDPAGQKSPDSDPDHWLHHWNAQYLLSIIYPTLAGEVAAISQPKVPQELEVFDYPLIQERGRC